MFRTFLFLVMFLFSMPCFAEKQEFIDPYYDFSKAQKIFFDFSYCPTPNGINERETAYLFYQKIKKDVLPTLKKKGYTLLNRAIIYDDFKKNKGVDLYKLSEEAPLDAHEILHNFLKENVDLVVRLEVLSYDVGSEYYEGYTINVPTTTTTNFSSNYGYGTATTYTTTPQYVPGGNFPVAYCAVRVDVYDLKQDINVWNRIDDRAKLNRTVLDNTKPKDMYKRILNSYFDDFKDVIKSTPKETF